MQPTFRQVPPKAPLPDGAFQDFEGHQEIERDQRHHDIQFQLPGLRRTGDRLVVAQHLEADHREHLGHDGIHLSRHDRGTRLAGRQFDFAKAGAGTGAQQPQVGTSNFGARRARDRGETAAGDQYGQFWLV